METSELGTPEEPRCPEDTAVESCEISDSSHSKKFCISCENTFQMQSKQCRDLKQAALQVDPESVARPVPCDLRMHSLNTHCIFKLYNILIYMGFQQKDLNLDPA